MDNNNKNITTVKYNDCNTILYIAKHIGMEVWLPSVFEYLIGNEIYPYHAEENKSNTYNLTKDIQIFNILFQISYKYNCESIKIQTLKIILHKLYKFYNMTISNLYSSQNTFIRENNTFISENILNIFVSWNAMIKCKLNLNKNTNKSINGIYSEITALEYCNYTVCNLDLIFEFLSITTGIDYINRDYISNILSKNCDNPNIWIYSRMFYIFNNISKYDNKYDTLLSKIDISLYKECNNLYKKLYLRFLLNPFLPVCNDYLINNSSINIYKVLYELYLNSTDIFLEMLYNISVPLYVYFIAETSKKELIESDKCINDLLETIFKFFNSQIYLHIKSNSIYKICIEYLQKKYLSLYLNYIYTSKKYFLLPNFTDISGDYLQFLDLIQTSYIKIINIQYISTELINFEYTPVNSFKKEYIKNIKYTFITDNYITDINNIFKLYDYLYTVKLTRYYTTRIDTYIQLYEYIYDKIIQNLSFKVCLSNFTDINLFQIFINNLNIFYHRSPYRAKSDIFNFLQNSDINKQIYTYESVSILFKIDPVQTYNLNIPVDIFKQCVSSKISLKYINYNVLSDLCLIILKLEVNIDILIFYFMQVNDSFNYEYPKNKKPPFINIDRNKKIQYIYFHSTNLEWLYKNNILESIFIYFEKNIYSNNVIFKTENSDGYKDLCKIISISDLIIYRKKYTNIFKYFDSFMLESTDFEYTIIQTYFESIDKSDCLDSDNNYKNLMKYILKYPFLLKKCNNSKFKNNPVLMSQILEKYPDLILYIGENLNKFYQIVKKI